MSKVTHGRASKLVGKSKPTISKAIRDGKLSGQKVDGVFQIEKSELLRVYDEVKDVKKDDKKAADKAVSATSAVAALEKKHLEEKVADLEARLAKTEDKLDETETRERAANARVFALIEDKTTKSFWGRLTGK